MARSHIKEKEKGRRTGAPRPSSIPFFQPVCGSGMRNTHCKPALFVRWTTPRPTGTETHAFLLCHILLTFLLYPFFVTLQPFSGSAGPDTCDTFSLRPAHIVHNETLFPLHCFISVSCRPDCGGKCRKTDLFRLARTLHFNHLVQSAHTERGSGNNLWIFSKTSGFFALFII